MEPTLEILVEQAKRGDKNALESLIKRIQDRVYGLAIRMLGHPADAEDATQEILTKVLTHLVSFRQESAFITWVYRVASNHLLTTRKRRAERKELTFEQCEREINRIASGRWLESSLEAEQSLLMEEIRIRCMQSILLCLDRGLRIAYILGEIFELTSDKGGYILNIAPTAFRKRLFVPENASTISWGKIVPLLIQKIHVTAPNGVTTPSKRDSSILTDYCLQSTHPMCEKILLP